MCPEAVSGIRSLLFHIGVSQISGKLRPHITGSGRSPGEGNGNRLQYSCLGNPMDRGAWRASIHGVARSQT